MFAPSRRVLSASRSDLSAPSLTGKARISMTLTVSPPVEVEPVDLDHASAAAEFLTPRMERRNLVDAFGAVDASGIVHGLALLADHGDACEITALMALGTPGVARMLMETAQSAARRAGCESIWLDGREADYTIGQVLCEVAKSLGWELIPERPNIAVGISSRCWWTLDLTTTPQTPEGNSALDADCGV